MSALLDSLLTPAQRAECALHDPDTLPEVHELTLADWLAALLDAAVSQLFEVTP